MRLKTLALLVGTFGAGICVRSALAAILQSGPAPEATVVAPEHYHVEFENEFVRVVRVRFAPHATMVMHQHPAPGGILVTVTDQDARITAPDGSARDVHYRAGEFRWAGSTPGADVSALSAHREENLSDKAFEMIRIEPKRPR
jgi:hypothetical protein